MKKRIKYQALYAVSNCSYEDCLNEQQISEKVIIQYNSKKEKIDLPSDLSFRNLQKIVLPNDLSRFNLEGSLLNNINFKKKKLPLKIRYASLKKSDLRFIQNTHIDLSYSKLTRSKLPKNLQNFKLKGTVLDYVDLSEHILPVDLRSTSFIGCKLPADISHCCLIGANLSKVNLTKTILPADLNYVIFDGAKLSDSLAKKLQDSSLEK